MPKGPQGQKRPADVIGNAIMVAKIATGEVEDEKEVKSAGKVRSGHAGARARNEALTPDERSDIARKAANGRWG
jgi:hypothetical protein